MRLGIGIEAGGFRRSERHWGILLGYRLLTRFERRLYSKRTNLAGELPPSPTRDAVRRPAAHALSPSLRPRMAATIWITSVSWKGLRRKAAYPSMRGRISIPASS